MTQIRNIFFKVNMLSYCSVFVLLLKTYCYVTILLLLMLTVFPSYTLPDEECYITLDRHQEVIAVVTEEFLSVSIGIRQIDRLDEEFFANPRFRKLAQELAPARLRVGGKTSDRLIFSKDFKAESCQKLCPTNYPKYICTVIKDSCDTRYPYVLLTAKKWEAINEFCKATKLRLLFSVNVLLHNQRGWDDQNAKELLEYSKQKYPDIDWQLGNEPNSFRLNFKVLITPHELAQDFKHFRNLLNRYGYSDSLLIGPDISQLIRFRYMADFLSKGSDYVNASSFHQYYLNSRTAELKDFWNHSTMDRLEIQLKIIRDHTLVYKNEMWLSETSSSFGGGTKGLSDSFAASPLWLDKLGLAATYNISTVIRYTFFGGHYSLVNNTLHPLPDWWISVLYKRLVGKHVLRVKYRCSPFQRVYAHCANRKYTSDSSAVTIFALNLKNEEAKFLLKGTALEDYSMDEYVITPEGNNRLSQTVLLNGKPLYFESSMPELKPKVISNRNYILMPPYSIGFWVIKNTYTRVCTAENVLYENNSEFSDFWFIDDL